MYDPAKALSELKALWAEATQTTKGYKQMAQPLPAGTHWANAQQHYLAAADALTPDPTPPPPGGSAKPTFAMRIGSSDMLHISHPDAYGYFACHLWAAAAAKTFLGSNPAKLLVYREAHMSDAGGLPATDAYKLRDAAGRTITLWGATIFLADVGSAAYRQAWADRVIADAQAQGFAGVFIDDVFDGAVLAETVAGNGFGMPTAYPTQASWDTAMAGFSDYVSGRLRAAGLLVVPNLGNTGAEQPRQWHVDRATAAGHAFQEHWMGWRNATSVFTGAAWDWKRRWMQLFQAAGVPYLTLIETGNLAAGLYSWASFMLFAGPGDSWGRWPQDGTDPYATWWDRDLGAPVAAATQSGSVWTRRYEKATVTVDTAAGTATVA